MPGLVEKVPGFKKHIRMFIVHTLATTFQAVKRQNMEQCLDLVSLSNLLRRSLLALRGVVLFVVVVFAMALLEAIARGFFRNDGWHALSDRGFFYTTLIRQRAKLSRFCGTWSLRLWDE